MHVLTSRENDCRSCYKCIRHCPTKSISFHDGQASIIFDECVLCGRCFSVCPQSCKVIRDDKQKALDLIKNNKCIASIAPSFSSSYHGVSFESLKKMGVVLKRAHYFITCGGKQMFHTPIEADYITRQLITVDKKGLWNIQHSNESYSQMTLADFGIS